MKSHHNAKAIEAQYEVRIGGDSRWQHQARDLRDLRRATSGDSWRVLYVAFMGSGKTVVAAKLVNEWVAAGQRALVLTHRQEILEQTDAKLRKAGISEEKIGIIWRDSPRANPSAPVQLASIDTLVRRDRPEGITRIVIDEAHHAAAAKWRKVLAWYPGVPILGMTATPERLDGKPLGDLFDTMVESDPPETLINAGTISRPEVYGRDDDWMPDMTGSKKRGGDWRPEDAAAAMSGTVIVGSIPGHWRKHAENLPTVGFAATVAQAEGLVAAFMKAGIRAELLVGTMNSFRRRGALARLKSGETKVLWTCDVLGEGWDYPGARCAILARQTCSLARYLQWCGRVMRAGAVTPKILDHCGNYSIHQGPPWQDQEWDLHKKRGDRKIVARKAEGGRVEWLPPVQIEGQLVRLGEKPRQRVCAGIPGRNCDKIPHRAAFYSKQIQSRRGEPWRCKSCAAHPNVLLPQEYCAGSGDGLLCKNKTPVRAFSPKQTRSRNGEPWICQSCFLKKRDRHIVNRQLVCDGCFGEPCPKAAIPPRKALHPSSFRNRGGPWKCVSCAMRKTAPSTQLICAGWKGKCPSAAVPVKHAFNPAIVRSRNGEPWRCKSCGARKATDTIGKSRLREIRQRAWDSRKGKKS
jgi:superfamily II DNA or RNA helicase